MKLPYFKWYATKWIEKTQGLSLEIQGAISRIYSLLWLWDPRGQRTLSLEEWGRVLGVNDPHKTWGILARLERAKLVVLATEGGGSGVDDVTLWGVSVNADVTLSVTWMLRYAEKLDSTTERVKKWRRQNGHVNADVNANDTRLIPKCNATDVRSKTLDVRQKTTTNIVADLATSEGSTPAGYGDLVDHIRASYKAGPGKGQEFIFGGKEGKAVKRMLGIYSAEEVRALWDEFIGRSWDWINRDNKKVQVPRNLEVFESKIPVLLEEGAYKSRIMIKKTKEEASGTAGPKSIAGAVEFAVKTMQKTEGRE